MKVEFMKGKGLDVKREVDDHEYSVRFRKAVKEEIKRIESEADKQMPNCHIIVTVEGEEGTALRPSVVASAIYNTYFEKKF